MNTASPESQLVELLALAQKHGHRPGPLFRPSSANRWINCPGSIRLGVLAGPGGKSSAAAREGTAAHKVAEDALRGVRQPHEWTDRMVQLDEGGMHGVFVDAEMTEKTQFYVDGAMKWRDGLDDVQEFVESKLSLAPLDPSDPFMSQVAGTADHVLTSRRAQRVVVRDLKYGKGVRVLATSPQPRVYSLMQLVSLPNRSNYTEVVCEITQPRLPNPDDWVTEARYSVPDLMDFLGTVYEATQRAVEPDAPLVPGSHCRWCPAEATCPALASKALTLAQSAFSAAPLTVKSLMPAAPVYAEATDPAPPPDAIVLPNPATAWPGQIASWLAGEDLVVGWFRALRERAARMIESGIEVPGYKLVARSTHRKWADPDIAAAALMSPPFNLTEDNVYDTSPAPMLSPARVERKLNAAQKREMAALIVQPPGEPVLVEANDPRPAVVTAAFPVLGVAKE